MLSGGAGLLDGFSQFDFSARRNILAAVSGGGDSLALLLLLQAHLRQAAPAARLLAVTVDHALRPESAGEAAAVAAFCAARGVSHEILRWEGGKPESGLSAAARAARYRLLAGAAETLGGDLVLTGHSADDQVETVLMRKARGPGPGLAGIAPATLFEGRVWFGRPLLGRSREELRIFLQGQGVLWIDDPSNENPAYERVRARRELAGSGDAAGLKRALLVEARQAAAARVALGERAAAAISAHARLVAPGLVRLDRAFLGEDEAALHGLRLLIAAIGGREHLPDRARAAAVLERMMQGRCRATLAGAVVDARKAALFLHREFRGKGPAAIPAADGAVWDGRFRLGLAGEAEAGSAIGPAARDAEPAEAPGGVPASLVRAASAAEPAIRGDDGARRVEASLVPLVAPFARLLPSFDLAPARALAGLLGAQPFPEPPFARHDRP